MVLNIDGAMGHKIRNRKYPRHGTQCVIQYPTNRYPAQSLQENTITMFGLRLYDSLPKYLRNMESVKTKKIKFETDNFLEIIPDEPQMINYVTSARTNNILDQQSHLTAQGISQGGAVHDSATELI